MNVEEVAGRIEMLANAFDPSAANSLDWKAAETVVGLADEILPDADVEPSLGALEAVYNGVRGLEVGSQARWSDRHCYDLEMVDEDGAEAAH